MAKEETVNVANIEAEEIPAAPETVSKADYDALAKQYQRVVTAYNKLLSIIANDYAEKVSKAVFDDIDKNESK